MKSCLINLITLYNHRIRESFRLEKTPKIIEFNRNEMPGLVDKRRPIGIVYSGLIVAFDTISHMILIDKMMKYGLDEQRGGVKTG